MDGQTGVVQGTVQRRGHPELGLPPASDAEQRVVPLGHGVQGTQQALRCGNQCVPRRPVPSARGQAGARVQAVSSSNAVVLARQTLRTKTKPPSGGLGLAKDARKRRHRFGKNSAADLLQRLQDQKIHGQSRFCDVCGYRNPQVKCRACPASFHKVCLGMQPVDAVPEDWNCHACKRREIERSNGDRELDEALAIVETARRKAKWKPPDSPMQCSSCGYHESESMNCDSCKRWFCFACMCLSAATLPIKSWSCPECVGQDRYDEGRRKLIETSCRRVREEKVTAKEQDGFSQLVFDLSCTCNWDEWERNIDTLIEHARKQLKKGQIPVVMPFHSLHYSRPSKQGMDKLMIRQISEAYAKLAKDDAYKAARVKMCDDGQAAEEFRAWKPERLKFSPNDKVPRLRIGYLSSDFVDHPTADLIQSALLKHDKDKFEIFCYSISREDDSEYRQRLRFGMEHFKHFCTNQNDKKCAEQIAADGIHILVNLNGHTAGDRNGISALRPAPLQLVYLAYPGTMGADYIDYNVTDKTVCPDEHRNFYTEHLIYMPHCYQTNSFRELYSDVLDTAKLPKRSDHHLPDQPTFIFCNFCRLGRITPDLFEVWMRILRRVPDSVLWLYKHPKAAVWRLQSRAEKAGVDPERLIFGSPCSPKLEHLKRVTLADLALDTLVYNGHTTASDMLWAGVPLVTMRGDNWPSLVATCISEAAEMGEMVVDDLQKYEDKAVQLAEQPALLKKLKRKLVQKRKTAPLFDSGHWIRNFELSLDEVWRRYVDKEDAGDIVVKNLKPVNTRRLFLRDGGTCGSLRKAVGNGTCDGCDGLQDVAAAAAELCKEIKVAKPADSPRRKESAKNAAAGRRCQEHSPEASEGGGVSTDAVQVRDHLRFSSPQQVQPVQQAAAKEKKKREKIIPMLVVGQKKQRKKQVDPLASMQVANAPSAAPHVDASAEILAHEHSAQRCAPQLARRDSWMSEYVPAPNLVSAIAHRTAAEMLMGDDDPLMTLAQVVQDDSARVHDTDNRQLAAATSELQSRIRSHLPPYSHPENPNHLHRYQQLVRNQQQQHFPLSSSVGSQQHMLVQGSAAAGPGLSMPKPQAEWAGSIADVVNLTHASVHSVSNGPNPGEVLVSALPMRQNADANHRTSLIDFGSSSGQYPGPSQQWRGGPLEGGGEGREAQARLALGDVPGDAPAPLPNSASIEEMVSNLKAIIKNRVRKVCNDEYRQHHERDSASEAVKTHLKTVALHAQVWILKHLVRLKPGQKITE